MSVVTLPRMARQRLDTLLAERGLFESRSRAAAAVMAGRGAAGAGGERADKPGQMVADDVDGGGGRAARGTSRAGGSSWPTRSTRSGSTRPGGAAWTSGASTGGFTDCLLQRGRGGRDRARRGLRRAALEAAPGSARDGARAHQRPRAGPGRAALRPRPGGGRRVVHLADARCSAAVLGARRAARSTAWRMVKPQFEVGREPVGKGGVVRDAADRARRAGGGGRVRARGARAAACSATPRRACPGPAGQRGELRAGSPRPAATGAVEDLEAAARRVEP